ncbi:MAG: hypothetical protein AVDCRST_MAG44-498, partial [uncultured Sphingomonas sp.]
PDCRSVDADIEQGGANRRGEDHRQLGARRQRRTL